MTRQDIHEAVKRILEVQEKKNACVKACKEYLHPDGDAHKHNFSRVLCYFMDISGTPAAEEKNRELYRAAETVKGRRELFRRYINDLTSIDPTLPYKGTPEDIIALEQQHPMIFTAMFDNSFITSGMTDAAGLTDEAKGFMREVSALWDTVNAFNSFYQLAARDDYVEKPADAPGYIDEMSAADGFGYALKRKGERTNGRRKDDSPGHFLAWGRRNEDIANKDKLKELEQQGILGPDIYRYKFLNDKKEPVNYRAAIEGILEGKAITWQQKTAKELAAMEKALAQPCKPSPYEMLQNASKEGENLIQILKDMDVNAKKSIYNTILQTMRTPCHQILDPAELSSMSFEEQMKQIGTHRNDLATMAILAEHGNEIAEDMQELGFTAAVCNEVKFRAQLYEPVMECAKAALEPEIYQREKDITPEKIRQLDAVRTNAVGCLDTLPGDIGSLADSMIDGSGKRYSPAQAARRICNGEEIYIPTGKNVETGRYLLNNAAMPVYVGFTNGAADKDKTFVHMGDRVKYMTPQTIGKIFYEQIKATDPKHVWTNSDQFAQLRDGLKELADGKAKGNEEEKLESLMRLSRAYIDRKVGQIREGQTLNERSEQRLDLTRQLRACVAARQRENQRALGQNEPQVRQL